MIATGIIPESKTGRLSKSFSCHSHGAPESTSLLKTRLTPLRQIVVVLRHHPKTPPIRRLSLFKFCRASRLFILAHTGLGWGKYTVTVTVTVSRKLQRPASRQADSAEDGLPLPHWLSVFWSKPTASTRLKPFHYLPSPSLPQILLCVLHVFLYVCVCSLTTSVLFVFVFTCAVCPCVYFPMTLSCILCSYNCTACFSLGTMIHSSFWFSLFAGHRLCFLITYSSCAWAVLRLLK